MKQIVQNFVDGFLFTFNTLKLLFKNPLFLIGSIIIILAQFGLSAILLIVATKINSLLLVSRILDSIVVILCFYIIATAAYNKTHYQSYSFLSLLKSIKIVPFIFMVLLWRIVNAIIVSVKMPFAILIQTIILSIVGLLLSLFIAVLADENKGTIETIKQYITLVKTLFWQLMGGAIGIFALAYIPSVSLYNIGTYIQKTFTIPTYVGLSLGIPLFGIFGIIIIWNLIMICTAVIFGVLLHYNYKKQW
jgi:hypothetical protein